MSYLDSIKSVTKFVVSIGAGAVVGNAIKTQTPLDTKPLAKAAIIVGGIVLSNMVGHAAAKYTEDSIDTVIDEVHKVQTQVEESKNKKTA